MFQFTQTNNSLQDIPMPRLIDFLKGAWRVSQKLIMVLSVMHLAPKILQVFALAIGHGWIAVLANLYPVFVLVVIAACLVAASEFFSIPHLQLVGAIVLLIALAWPTYVMLAPPVVDCAQSINQKKIAAACETTLTAYCSEPLVYKRNSTGRSLPYIDGENYIEQLQAHVCNLPVKRTLVVWGPKSVGKSEGLKRAMNAWHEQGRKVVRMELKGFTGDYSQFVSQFRHQILNFVGVYPFTHGDILILQQCLASPQPLSYKTEDQLAQLLHYLGFHEVAHIRENELTTWRQNWNDYVTSIFNNPRDITKIDFPKLLDLLDLIALLHPDTAPILIFSEIQSLEKLGEQGNALLRTIIVTLERTKTLNGFTPVIFETSDALWAADILFQPSVLSSREAYQGFFVESFTKQAGHKVLVREQNLLTEEQYDTLWEALGGHAGSWDIVYSRLNRFNDVQKVIDIELNEVRKQLYGVIHHFPGNQSDIIAQLQELRKSKFVANLDISNPAVRYLVVKNVLYRQDDITFSPQYKLIQTAITKYLDQVVPTYLSKNEVEINN